jgi:CRP-like cAMP-binding protein
VFRGGATLVVDVLAVTALQRAAPPDQLSRVFGVFFASILGAISLGTLITPVVVSAFGLNGGLLTMAIGPSLLGLLRYPALIGIDRETAALADALARRVAVLEQLDIFASASRPELERLLTAATEVGFAPGVAIEREGQPADALFVLLEGEVEVTARGERGGPERRVRTTTAPAYFGEIGVLERTLRTATVTALSDCRCERIEGEALLAALSTAPPSCSLMEIASSRLAVTHPWRQITIARSDAPEGGRTILSRPPSRSPRLAV